MYLPVGTQGKVLRYTAKGLLIGEEESHDVLHVRFKAGTCDGQKFKGGVQTIDCASLELVKLDAVDGNEDNEWPFCAFDDDELQKKKKEAVVAALKRPLLTPDVELQWGELHGKVC